MIRFRRIMHIRESQHGPTTTSDDVFSIWAVATESATEVINSNYSLRQFDQIRLHASR